MNIIKKHLSSLRCYLRNYTHTKRGLKKAFSGVHTVSQEAKYTVYQELDFPGKDVLPEGSGLPPHTVHAGAAWWIRRQFGLTSLLDSFPTVWPSGSFKPFSRFSLEHSGDDISESLDHTQKISVRHSVLLLGEGKRLLSEMWLCCWGCFCLRVMFIYVDDWK